MKTKDEQFTAAIPTFYAGTQFKSRMEAQCAVLFDKLGWKWEYEKFSLMLPSGTSFIPDFWIQCRWLLIECRGYKSKRGDQQTEELGHLLMSSAVGSEPKPLLELPNDDGELYDFLVIGPDCCKLYSRKKDSTEHAVLARCNCGTWTIIGAWDCCHACLKDNRFNRYIEALALTVSNGKLILNGKPLNEVSL